MADESTERITRNALNQYLPIAKVFGIIVFVGGMIWWVANQSRDIVDARRVAEDAMRSAEKAATAAAVAAADNGALKIKEAEILTKLSGIEAQLAELRAIMLRRTP